jgi:hypothetical protein
MEKVQNPSNSEYWFNESDIFTYQDERARSGNTSPSKINVSPISHDFSFPVLLCGSFPASLQA